jgi:hypothetical protein
MQNLATNATSYTTFIHFQILLYLNARQNE